MIDYFALALIHGLLAIALVRLAGNPAVDIDPSLADESKRSPRRRPEPPGDA